MSDTDSDGENEPPSTRTKEKGEKVKSRTSIKQTAQSSPSLGSSTRTSLTSLRTGSRSSTRLSKNGSRGEEDSLTTAPSTSNTPIQKDGDGDDDDGDCITAVCSQESQDQEEQRRLSGDRPRRVQTSRPTSPDSPTPTPRKRKIEPTPPRQSVRPTRSRSNTSQANSAPEEIPASRRRDVTPPRTVSIAEPSTPTLSPRDFAHLFAAISPDPSSLPSPSRKRLIGQSQSSGAVLESPSKLRRGFSHVYDSSGGRSGPSTPSKLLNRTHSMPISPSKSPLQEGDPSALWIKPVETEGPGSGGRAKRIYGRTRTVVAEAEDTVTNVEKLEEALSKESYASLRSRYEVNSGETTLSQEELSVCLYRFYQGLV
jgi:hypothetical protein